VTLTLTDFALNTASESPRHALHSHFLWSESCAQVSSAFLFSRAYMHSLYSGFYAKEDVPFTPGLCAIFPTISDAPRTAAEIITNPRSVWRRFSIQVVYSTSRQISLSNYPRSNPARPSTHLSHRDFFLGHNSRFTFLGGIVSLALLLLMPPLFLGGHPPTGR
jgi:hypothetical protein